MKPSPIEQISGSARPKARLSLGLRTAVFLRSLALQASWNHQRMQNLGLLVTMLPWLRSRPRQLQTDRHFCRRYYGFFNTNPYLANYLVGGLLRLESDHAAADPAAGDLVATFRDSLGRAFASFGDQLFWMALRPAFFVLLCLLALFGQFWLPLVLVGMFALWQLTLRWFALGRGFELGLDIVDLLGRSRWHRAITWIRRLGIFLTGFATGLFLLGLFKQPPGATGGAVWVAALLGLALPLGLRRRASGEVSVLVGAVAVIFVVFAISWVSD